jgi:hypothetical protein
MQIGNCNAAVNGGGISIKSGRAFFSGNLEFEGNNANGSAVDGYGNGGGVFVTTSYHDDKRRFGAGWGAATLYDCHGEIWSSSSDVFISKNRANCWGGGLYVGISPPWYGSSTRKGNLAMITLMGANIHTNTALQAANESPLKPAQIAAERVKDNLANLNFKDTNISGDSTTDIGIYLWDSIVPYTEGTIFGALAAPTITEGTEAP